MKIKDKDWWAANPIKTLTSAITTHLYYDPSATLGNLNFWPICTVANPIRLELWNSIAQALDTITPLAMPQGYWEATVTSLAIALAPSLSVGGFARVARGQSDRDGINRRQQLLASENSD